MRFIQKNENILEIHNKTQKLPLSLATLGLAMVIVGFIYRLKENLPPSEQSLALGILAVGGLIFLVSVVLIFKYNCYFLYKDDTALIETDLWGIWKRMKEPGSLNKVLMEVIPGEGNQVKYKITLNYGSGKTYLMEETSIAEKARAVAEIFSFFLEKPVTVKSGDKEEEMKSEVTGNSLPEKLRNQYPKGMPRREPPNIEYLTLERARFRDLFKFHQSPASKIYILSIYTFLLGLVTLGITVYVVDFVAFGIVVALFFGVVFFVINSLEKANTEELWITPQGLKYVRQKAMSEVNIEVPLDDIKSIATLPRSGYILNKPQLPPSPPSEGDINVKPVIDPSQGIEVYIYTAKGIISVESWMNEEMANHFVYLVKNSIYTMHEKEAKKSKQYSDSRTQLRDALKTKAPVSEPTTDEEPESQDQEANNREEKG